MITLENLRSALSSLGYQQAEGNESVDAMVYNVPNSEYVISVDFKNGKIHYPDSLLQ